MGLDNTTAGDQGFIDAWVNAGVLDVMMRTDCQVRAADMSLTTGTWKYTTDSSILKIVTAYVSTAAGDYTLERVSVQDLIEMQLASSQTVSPAQFYAFDGADYFMIYPTPASDDTVVMFYVPAPATLSASADIPTEIPTEYQKAIEFYALREAADFSDDGTSQMGNLYLQQYEAWIKRIKKWQNMKGSQRLPIARIRPMTSRVYHDRSRY